MTHHRRPSNLTNITHCSLHRALFPGLSYGEAWEGSICWRDTRRQLEVSDGSVDDYLPSHRAGVCNRNTVGRADLRPAAGCAGPLRLSALRAAPHLVEARGPVRRIDRPGS